VRSLAGEQNDGAMSRRGERVSVGLNPKAFFFPSKESVQHLFHCVSVQCAPRAGHPGHLSILDSSSHRRFASRQNMASPSVSALLEGLATAGKAFERDEAGSREALIENSRALVAALEIPSEFIQRSFWAEVDLLPKLLALTVVLTMHNSLPCPPTSASPWM
jgi:hypothetical protein